MQSKKIKQALLLVGSMACLLSCGPEPVYDQFQVVEDTDWDKSKVYYFTFMIEDNSVPYDVTLSLRNNNFYPYQNLWIFSQEESPSGELTTDTTEYTLADEYGRWTGQGISLYHSNFLIRQHYRFPYPGQYTFSFRHGMRDDVLRGIQEIGLRIYQSK